MGDIDPEVWNEKVAVTRTARENILRYLYQEGETSRRELKQEIRLHRDTTGQHFKFLEENRFTDRIYQARGTTSNFELTDKGEDFVKDELLGGNPPHGI